MTKVRSMLLKRRPGESEEEQEKRELAELKQQQQERHWRRFWAFAEKCHGEVAKWPAWKRNALGFDR